MDNMITNALGFNTPIYVPNDVDDPADDEYDADVNVERPNEEAQRFFDLLKETNTPLCEGSRDSKLTVCIRLLGIKSECLVSEYTMDLITKLMLDITIDRPLDLPKNYYEARQLVAKLGLGAKRIDCCVNGCMLYYSNEFGVDDGALLECTFCQEPRYRVTRNSRSVRRKPIPRKAMFYLPIIPRLQRLYASMQTASKMTWHRENYERRKMSDYLTSRQVWNKVKDIPKVEVVGGVASKPRGYGQTHNWTKRSIFWDLPYWKDNLLRHNLDVMHIEKNVFENIFNTVMNVKGKTKDNDNARRDIGLYCKRNELLLVETSNGKLLKPRANYTLSPEEAKSVCRWVKEVKMPDGYSSNLARCADVDHGRMRGMKSHDCHVFFQTLLPIAFSSLPQHVLNPLIEISQFFKNLCSTTLREADLIKMENDIPLILCKLERIFPPALFDSMEHVVVHLAYEARLGGPVQYRWMYPFERFMGYAKRAVKNKAMVEGSICATYLHRETIYFCSHYFKDTLSSSHIRNETETSRPVRIHPLNMSIFSLPGRNGGGEKVLYPGDKVLYSAHVHLLINCNEVEPYLQMFLTQHTSAQINSEFPAWFKEYMYQQTPATRVIQHLRNLSDGPKSTVKQWHTYFVNGYRFETHSWSEGKTTVNSGVCMKGVTENGEGDFYGVIENIFEIEYNYLDYKKTVVLFYCKWFDPSNRGTRYDSKTNTVDIKMNKHYPLY
ncbi:unnamed protein product, partial [Trifolium pratense]